MTFHRATGTGFAVGQQVELQTSGSRVEVKNCHTTALPIDLPGSGSLTLVSCEIPTTPESVETLTLLFSLRYRPGTLIATHAVLWTKSLTTRQTLGRRIRPTKVKVLLFYFATLLPSRKGRQPNPDTFLCRTPLRVSVIGREIISLSYDGIVYARRNSQNEQRRGGRVYRLGFLTPACQGPNFYHTNRPMACLIKQSTVFYCCAALMRPWLRNRAHPPEEPYRNV